AGKHGARAIFSHRRARFRRHIRGVVGPLRQAAPSLRLRAGSRAVSGDRRMRDRRFLDLRGVTQIVARMSPRSGRYAGPPPDVALRAHPGYEPGFTHRSTGVRAARVSSRRRRGASRGASTKRSFSPAFAAKARSRMVAMNKSSEALLSDSVGSISMAPWATSGKYTVIGW